MNKKKSIFELAEESLNKNDKSINRNKCNEVNDENKCIRNNIRDNKNRFELKNVKK